MQTPDSFDRVSLGLFPTPIHRLNNLSGLLNINLYIKRDDLTGVGLGGNKVRKLEFLLADARRKGARVVFTTGGAQSNHAMLTAAAAGRLGMRPILILKKRGVTACVGNQLLERLMGTEVIFMDTDDYADIYAEMDRLGAQIGEPYYKIPCGGSNALGCLGYVSCAREIAPVGAMSSSPEFGSTQRPTAAPVGAMSSSPEFGPSQRPTAAPVGAMSPSPESSCFAPRFDHIICAVGSGGTLAGLALGAKLYLPGTRVHGMMVDTDPFDVITPRLMREAAALMALDLPISGDFPESSIRENQFRPWRNRQAFGLAASGDDFTLRDMCGPGYAIPSEAGNAAVQLMAAREGIFLDPVYTGKAFAGLIELAREGAFGPDENVLFVHTGGAGGLFAIQ